MGDFTTCLTIRYPRRQGITTFRVARARTRFFLGAPGHWRGQGAVDPMENEVAGGVVHKSAVNSSTSQQPAAPEEQESDITPPNSKGQLGDVIACPSPSLDERGLSTSLNENRRSFLSCDGADDDCRSRTTRRPTRLRRSSIPDEKTVKLRERWCWLSMSSNMIIFRGGGRYNSAISGNSAVRLVVAKGENCGPLHLRLPR